MLVHCYILLCRARTFVTRSFNYLHQNNLLQPLGLSVEVLQQENVLKNDGQTSLSSENMKKMEQQVYTWFILH